jgi:Zn-dependent protease with chaperone function
MKFKLVVLVILLALLVPSLTIAQGDDEIWGEIHITIDYDLGHTITLFLPEHVAAEPFIDAALDLAGAGAFVEYIDFYAGDQFIIIAAPQLITQSGRIKTLSMDLSEVHTLAGKVDLVLDAYLIKVKPLYLFDLYLTDVGLRQPSLILDWSDDWEMWWKIPLSERTDFAVQLELATDLTWEVFIPTLIFMAWGIFLIIMHKKKPLFWSSRWLLTFGHGLVAVAFPASLMFFGWMPLYHYFSGRPDGGVRAAVLTTLLIYFSLMILTSYMKSLVTNKRISLQEFFARYSFTILYLLLIGMLAGIGLWLWPFISRFSWWLGIIFYLLAGPFLYGSVLIIVLRLLGARELHDPETSKILSDLMSKLDVQVKQKLIVPEIYCKLATAAFITSPPRVLVTEYLWHNTDPDEKHFILAHELAHAKLGFSCHIWANRVYVSIVAISIMLPTWLRVEPFLSLLGGFIAASLVQMLIFNPRLRRIELEADTLAISATGNPEAAISSLNKLEKLNSHYNVNQKTTHPTMKERVNSMQRDGVTALQFSKQYSEIIR